MKNIITTLLILFTITASAEIPTGYSLYCGFSENSDAEWSELTELFTEKLTTHKNDFYGRTMLTSVFNQDIIILSGDTNNELEYQIQMTDGFEVAIKMNSNIGQAKMKGKIKTFKEVETAENINLGPKYDADVMLSYPRNKNSSPSIFCKIIK